MIQKPRSLSGTALADRPPRLPGVDLPGGRIWPPVVGRLALHEAGVQGVVLERNAAGDWHGNGGIWMVSCALAGVYPDVDQGQTALLEWARWHAGLGEWLSPNRCVALGEDEDGAARLWQVVRREATLTDSVGAAMRRAEPDRIAHSLLAAARAMAETHLAVAPTGVRVGLDTVGVIAGRALYVGWAPTPRGLGQRPHDFEPRPIDLPSAFAPLVDRELAALAPRLAAITERLRRLAAMQGQEETGELLCSLLVGAAPARNRHDAMASAAAARQ